MCGVAGNCTEGGGLASLGGTPAFEDCCCWGVGSARIGTGWNGCWLKSAEVSLLRSSSTSSTISGSGRLEMAAGAAAGGSGCRIVLHRVGFGVRTIKMGGCEDPGRPVW
eukprot:2838429-Pleurochrysis_carterae.AAC.1